MPWGTPHNLPYLHVPAVCRDHDCGQQWMAALCQQLRSWSGQMFQLLEDSSAEDRPAVLGGVSHGDAIASVVRLLGQRMPQNCMYALRLQV